MKKSFSLFCLILLSQITLAQNILTPDWVKKKGSPVGGIAQGWGVDVDKQGNIYWPISVDSMNQGLDIICYKYDDAGNALWSTPFFFGGSGAQQAYSCDASDTALYIGGRQCPIHGFSCDMLLLKVDKNTKNLLWDKSLDFGNSGYDEIDGLEVTDDGIYCGGWGQALQTGPYQIDIGLWKVNFDGTTAWSSHLGKTGTAEHIDGHFVIDDSLIYGAGLWGGSNLYNVQNGHSFLGKFSKMDGSLQDSVLFGSQSNVFNDVDNALGMTSDGTYLYTTGYTILPGSTDWQIFIAKFDKNLNLIWYRDWGDVGNETARGIAVTGDKLFIAGQSESSNYAPGGLGDAILLEYDTAGNFISYKSWGDGLNNSFRDIVIDNNDIYLSGTSNVANSTGDTAFLIKTHFTFPNQIENLHSKKNKVVIYPNPTTDGQLTLEIKNNNSAPYNVQIFDLTGRSVLRTESNKDKLRIKLPRNSQILFYEIKSSKGAIERGKILQQ